MMVIPSLRHAAAVLAALQHADARIIHGRGAKRIQLVRGPKIRRQLLDELRGRVHPIGIFKREGVLICAKPWNHSFSVRTGRERTQIRQFSFERAAFRGKPEIVIDCFAQQAGQETQRQLPQRCEDI